MFWRGYRSRSHRSVGDGSVEVGNNIVDVAFENSEEGFIDKTIAINGGQEVCLGQTLRMKFDEGLIPGRRVGGGGWKHGERPNVTEPSERGKAVRQVFSVLNQVGTVGDRVFFPTA